MTQEYFEKKSINELPRLPLEGSIDLTYRCNNNCLHCWLRIPPDAKEKRDELSFAAIRKIADEARAYGCRRWSISGGEPMLRLDFADIFDYITRHSNSYSINTNGSLMTLKIAKLFKRKGTKMIALYGATAEVHDAITRSPGSFELTMRGFRYLKEAGAGFVVQLIPMKDNYYQFKDMIQLAESLSKHYRIGAAWLFLSACGDLGKNREIIRQRLLPKDVVELDKPDLSEKKSFEGRVTSCCSAQEDNYLLASCIKGRSEFHVDAYGQMSFCCFVKEPSLRYDLKSGSFREGWDRFIPSLAHRVKATKGYQEHCGSCELRKNCRWCPVYGYLEHGRFDAQVDYLCSVAEENKKFKESRKKNNRRYFKIADMTILVESDLPFCDNTFSPKFKDFEVDGPGDDLVVLKHHFSLPDFKDKDLGREVYRKPPWAVYKKNDSWVYLGISPDLSRGNKNLHRAAAFNSDHTRARIYNDGDKIFLKGGLESLTMFPTDQILLARLLADRQGCFLHSSGVIFKNKGLLFVGHSGAGKSTMVKMLKRNARILCDDRMIVRRKPEGFRIYGTWSHGEVPDVSGNSAPLGAIFFLKKSLKNKATLLKDKNIITAKLFACLIKPFVTADWWDKTLSVIEKIVSEVPCYELEFDKSGKVIGQL